MTASRRAQLEARKILGLNLVEDLSRSEIKSAYRIQARQHHPDTGGDPETFKLIASSAKLLGDNLKLPAAREPTRRRFSAADFDYNTKDVVDDVASAMRDINDILAGMAKENLGVQWSIEAGAIVLRNIPADAKVVAAGSFVTVSTDRGVLSISSSGDHTFTPIRQRQ